MKLSNRLTTLALCTLLFTVVGCAGTATTESTGEFVEDSRITTMVKAEILKEPGLKSREINVETFKGIVQLSGFVSSRAEASKAVQVAYTVKGVKSVKDDMLIK